MTEICEAITLKVEVPPAITLSVDFKGEFLSSSDGEDYKRGYDEGHAEGYADGEKVGYNNGYSQGLKDGEKEEQEKSITITENSTTEILPDENKVLSKVTVDVGVVGENPFDYATSLNRVFLSNIFPIGTEFELSFGKNASYCDSQFVYHTFYRALGLKSIKLNYEGDKSIFTGYAMASGFEGLSSAGDKDVLEIVDLSGLPQPIKPANISRCFYIRKKLKEIIGEFDLSESTNNNVAFGACTALETVRFTPNTIKTSLSFDGSPYLTLETIQSIIDGLADLTGTDAQVLTFGPSVKAKLTEEQIATITSKNWTLA